MREAHLCQCSPTNNTSEHHSFLNVNLPFPFLALLLQLLLLQIAVSLSTTGSCCDKAGALSRFSGRNVVARFLSSAGLVPFVSQNIPLL